MTELDLPPEEEANLNRVLNGIEIQMSRMGYNSARVERLIGIYKRSPSTADRDASDILRAAVVLLHASLEDYLRSVAAAYLPFRSPDVLNDVPLAGQGRERAEKFLLGSLAQFRGQTVDQVIERSISGHLERTTFNNCREIARLVDNLGVDISRVQSFFPELDALMLRRHQIVHRADLLDPAVREIRIDPIAPEAVEKWATNATEFAHTLTKVISAIEIQSLVDRTNKKRLLEAAEELGRNDIAELLKPGSADASGRREALNKKLVDLGKPPLKSP